MIYPEMWGSEGFMGLPVEARLLWVGLISLADDHGRGKASSAWLKAMIFPLDQYLPHHVHDWLLEINDRGMIRIYHVGGSSYYDIPNWTKYQKLRYLKDSIIPELNGDCTVTAQRLNSDCTKFLLKRDRLGEVRLGEVRMGQENETPRAENGASASPPFDWKPHIERWNTEIAQALGGVPQVQAMPPARIAKLKARLADCPDLWDAILAEAKFLGRWAREGKLLKFDFLMSQGNLVKFIEGNYRDGKEK